jgi:hypothetical protein
VGQRDQAPDQVLPSPGHPHVGQDQSRPVFLGGGDGGVPVGRVTDHAEVVLLVQQPGHGGSDTDVIVRDDDGDLTADRLRHDLHVRLRHCGCRDACAPDV